MCLNISPPKPYVYALCILQKEYTDMYVKRRWKLFLLGTQTIQGAICNTLIDN